MRMCWETMFFLLGLVPASWRSMRTEHSMAFLGKFILSAAASVSLLAVASCGGASAETEIDRGEMTTTVTHPAPFDEPLTLGGVKAGNPVDYIALRHQPVRRENGTWVNAGAPSARDSTGTACTTAISQVTCLQALEDLRPTVGFDDGSRHAVGDQSEIEYVVFTRGNEVGAITSREALAPFLSPVSNVETAAFLVAQNGRRLGTGPNAKSVQDGFELIGLTGGCAKGDIVDEQLLHVSKSGQLTVEKSVRTNNLVTRCIP